MKVAAALVGIVAAVVVAGGPMSASTGASCGGFGGALRWVAGAGSSARNAEIQHQADMATVLSDMQHDPSIANSPLGREAQADAGDAQNRAQASLPVLDSCDSTATVRLVGAVPVGLAASGLLVGAVWLIRAGREWLARRREQRGPAETPVCPLCGRPLSVESICAACSGFRAGRSEEWWGQLPDAPPDVMDHDAATPP